MSFKPHTETLTDGTVLTTDFYPGQDIDPRSGWCAISVNGKWLRDKFERQRRFRTFASAKKAALASLKA